SRRCSAPHTPALTRKPASGLATSVARLIITARRKHARTEADAMRIIALMNQKGGVGKTTTTANLGAALAELKQRVCLIALDPQAHLTINYGVEPTADVISLYDVLIDDHSFLEAVHKIDDNIALVP